MKLSDKGYSLIVKHETGGNIDKYLTAYKDPVGIWTIGIGNTFYENGAKVKQGDKISLERAKQLFYNIVPQFEKGVLEAVKIPLNQNQFDALVSLCYNIGVSAFKSSTVVKLINSKAPDTEIIQSWQSWNKGTISGTKTVLPGLVRRRKEETELFFFSPTGKKIATFASILIVVGLLAVLTKSF